jgi:predicted phage tail protein
MLRKIKLYGKLAKFIGHRVLEADVATAAEAVRFLLANWPELEAHMSDQHYRVSIGTYDIDLEELHHPAGAAPISFVPVVTGAGAVGRIIAGIALIALAIVFAPGGAWRAQLYWVSRCQLLRVSASALHLAASPSS